MRVMFVDDDETLLSGLRNLFRRHRRRWEMHFAIRGADALELFAEKPFDIVLSDMRMPGMNGAELLTHIQELDPSTVRMILSGYSDVGSVANAIPRAHLLLSKPSPPDMLIGTLERAAALSTLVCSERVAEALSRLGPIPRPDEALNALRIRPFGAKVPLEWIEESLPASAPWARGVLEQLDSEDSLGAPMAFGLLASIGLLAARGGTPEGIAALSGAVLTARVADGIAGGGVDGDHAGLAGMLYRIPELLGAPIEGEGNVEVWAPGVDAGLLAARVLLQWSLPLPVIEAVAHYRDPLSAPIDDRRVGGILHLADALVREAMAENRGGERGEARPALQKELPG
ncbi:MAG: response regulator, partial [Myxococcales bacterium]|nr:response regulator [Myxococcales bacterium]